MSRLTAAIRKSLKDAEFAEPEERKYPINDARHARNALARVSQFGTEREKAIVKLKVKKRFPKIRVGS